MRLTCPNCSARYEVEESMIPVGGRDVQCSNCSTTWFQPGPRAPEPPALKEPSTDTTGPRTLDEVVIESPANATGAAASQRPPRRQIDLAVADILREEADREARLRRTEAQPDPMEVQAEMPLDAAQGTARSRRLADLDETAEDAVEMDDINVGMTTVAAGSRRELLPDIEEINSTLRATDDRSAAEADATDYDTVGSAPRRRSQVRTGFFLVILIALIGAGLYAYSDQIQQNLPQAEPALDSFTALVDQARFWLDDMARSLAAGSGGTNG